MLSPFSRAFAVLLTSGEFFERNAVCLPTAMSKERRNKDEKMTMMVVQRSFVGC